MRKLIAFILSLTSYSIIAQGIVSQNGLLKVSGNRIKNKNDQNFSVAGNSVFWSSFINDGGKFYAEGTAKQMVDHLAQDWDSGLIRAAMGLDEADGINVRNTTPNFRNQLVVNPNGEGYFNNPTKEYAKIKRVIDAAIANDIYVIVDFHSHFAHLFEAEAIKFFTDIATEYKDNDHIIYEIYNEPIGLRDDKSEVNSAFNDETARRTWAEKIKPYAIKVIKAIRAIDPDNMIIVGTPAFSQFVDVAANNPITATDLNLTGNQLLNIAYTLHFYAATHSDFLRSKAKTALDKGIALFVTEWGTVEASGAGNLDLNETMKWLKFMEDNGISHANWSVSDKAADTSSIIKGGFGIQGLLSNALTPSGNLLKCVIQNWNAGTDYTGCTTDAEPSTGGGTDLDFPIGVGTKVDNGRSDAKSSSITSEVIGSSIVFKGLTSGSFIAYNLKFINNFDISKKYTLQAVVATSSDNNVLRFERNSGSVKLGDINLTNTGIDNYKIFTISGVEFEKDSNNNISFAIVNAGSGTGINIESIYVTEDNDPNLSVEEFNTLTSKFSVFPNPATADFKINSTLDENKISYSLYDLAGKTLLAGANYTGKVDISNFQKGTYILKIEVENKNRSVLIVKK